MVTFYLVASTVALGLVASFWSGKVGVNLMFKLIYVGLTVIGAICSAAALGLSA